MTNIPIQSSKGALRNGRHDRHGFVELPRNPVYIAMDGLTCSHNVGCIFRMADAVLARKLLLCGDTRLPLVSDHAIHLPMLGMSNSLNVSTATSVVLYDFLEKTGRRTR